VPRRIGGMRTDVVEVGPLCQGAGSPPGSTQSASGPFQGALVSVTYPSLPARSVVSCTALEGRSS
jgi:hypothetical protein